MTEPSPPYGAPPAAPSTRITEADLLEAIDYFSGLPDLEPLHRADAELAARLGEEIRRYRAMLIGLAAAADAAPGFETCACPDLSLARHAEGCPWPALEAEVKAIHEGRKIPTR